MIEYIYDTIRATSGEEIVIAAKITDEEGADITENCHLMIYDELNMLFTVDGYYDSSDGVWQFTLSEDLTKGYYGRYLYCICANDISLCFKKPIYFI